MFAREGALKRCASRWLLFSAMALMAGLPAVAATAAVANSTPEIPAAQCQGSADSKPSAFAGLTSFFGGGSTENKENSVIDNVGMGVKNFFTKVGQGAMPELPKVPTFGGKTTDGELAALGSGRALAAARELMSHQDPLMRPDPLAGEMAGDEGRSELVKATAKAKDRMPGFVQKLVGVDEKWMASNFLSLAIHGNTMLEPMLGVKGSKTSNMPQGLTIPQGNHFTQLVSIGVNTDTKAHYIPMGSDVSVWELDHPAVIDRREKIISSTKADRKLTCKARTAVSLDLTALGNTAGADTLAALKKRGWDAALPTIFLAETSLNYMPRQAAESIIETVGKEAAAGSVLMMTLVNDSGYKDKYGMQFGSNNPDKEFFGSGKGWKLLQYLDGFEAKHQQGRMSWMALRAFGPSTEGRMNKDSYGIAFLLAQKPL